MLDLKTFCRKIEPFATYYKRMIKSYYNTTHNILEKEINLLLPKMHRIQKCGIITTLVPSFIGLAYEGISSFLQNKRNKDLHKAITTLDNKADIQHNRLIHLENLMLMYGVYNAETTREVNSDCT